MNTPDNKQIKKDFQQLVKEEFKFKENANFIKENGIKFLKRSFFIYILASAIGIILMMLLGGFWAGLATFILLFIFGTTYFLILNSFFNN